MSAVEIEDSVLMVSWTLLAGHHWAGLMYNVHCDAE